MELAEGIFWTEGLDFQEQPRRTKSFVLACLKNGATTETKGDNIAAREAVCGQFLIKENRSFTKGRVTGYSITIVENV